MPARSDTAVLSGLEPLVLHALSAPEFAAGTVSIDRLRPAPVPLVLEVRLVMAEDAIVLWARLEAEAGHVFPPPLRASTWTGEEDRLRASRRDHLHPGTIHRGRLTQLRDVPRLERRSDRGTRDGHRRGLLSRPGP